MAKTTIEDILIYFYPVIFVMGTIGGILSFIIFSRKRFQNTIFSTYYRLLNIVDILALLSVLFVFIQDKAKLDHLQNFNLFCKMLPAIYYITPSISAWSVVIISFDRFLSVTMPTKFKFRKKFSYQMIVCFCVILANFLYYVKLIFSEIKIDKLQLFNISIDYEPECVYGISNEILIWMDFIGSAILPFFFMILFTILTLWSIHKSRNKVNSISHNTQVSINIIKQKDYKFSITSISLSIIFLMFNGPYAFFNILGEYLIMSSETYNLVIRVLLIFHYMNMASVFYINVIFNSIFKEELLKLIKIN